MANKDVLNVEHVQELIDRGKKQGLISYREIMDALQDVDLSPDQIEEIYEVLQNWEWILFLKLAMVMRWMLMHLRMLVK